MDKKQAVKMDESMVGTRLSCGYCGCAKVLSPCWLCQSERKHISYRGTHIFGSFCRGCGKKFVQCELNTLCKIRIANIKRDLEKINFENYLIICFPEIKSMLVNELSKLKEELISLSENALESEKLKAFEKCVIALNVIAENCSKDRKHCYGIHTEEREELCGAMYAMGTIVGLDGNSKYIDRWRDW